MIAAEKAQFPISLLCRVLGVSRSGFSAWQGRNSSERALAGAWLSERIREIHERSRQTYGARRVHAALGHRGVRVGRKRVERLMRGLGLSGLVPKRYRRTTIRLAGVRVADDLVERDFAPTGPDALWCADIKYVRTWQGWLYLAAVIDCDSRRIGVDRSIGSKGDCFDNALAESFFATLAKDLLRRKPFATRQQARTAVFGSIETFYNPIRLHSTLGYLPPVNYEKMNAEPKAA